MNLQWIENGEITHIYFTILLFVIKYQIINEKIFAKHRKIKEDINNKRFPVRVTHFTDLEIKKRHLSTF
jgi:hypothetical protein